ncbi:type VII secretion protein EccB, partial [Nocardia puris]|uniref:type VII secretion protein EccB n=1 Tax=Nocardia puris TaxID=208602 RepID=UPI001895CD8D
GSGELYVELADGVQRVSAFTAEVIRTADSQGMSQIKTMPPDVLAGIPLLNTLPVDHFPETAPRIVSAEDAPVSCLTWGKTDPTEDATAEGSADRATVRLLAGTRTPMPESALPVTLATSD